MSLGTKTKSTELDGRELRRRIVALGMTFTAAAELLGLTLNGLQKQMRGSRKVSQQTRLLLECTERERRAAARENA
jgi:hypothetical protein